ncbi:MAG: hypothetical protein QGI93_15130 [Planctomycetota bacterium]|nr:hypothetical protein [Planctomycetota bacterium]
MCNAADSDDSLVELATGRSESLRSLPADVSGNLWIEADRAAELDETEPAPRMF